MILKKNLLQGRIHLFAIDGRRLEHPPATCNSLNKYLIQYRYLIEYLNKWLIEWLIKYLIKWLIK